MIKKGRANKIIEIVIKALREINSSRFFKTERGFQGRFACALYKILDGKKIFPDDTIIEEEYQKRIGYHGTRLRPDLIIHIPFELGHSSSIRKDNFVIFAFKKQANMEDAKEDFDKLDEIFEKLGYPLGIFINIGGYPNIFLDRYSGGFKDRIHEFCAKLTNDKLAIRYAYFQNNKIKKTFY